MKNTTQLTKKLISLPSYKDGRQNEKPVSDFLYTFMCKHFPHLTVSTQKVAKNRYNIFATDGFPTTLLVVNQIDTVPPSLLWDTNPFTPKETEKKIIGLGATDSKGNIAAFLSALLQCGNTKGLALLWYVDEESQFAGMKHFVQSKEAKKINPTYVLSIDGNGCALGTSCRGVMECTIRIFDTPKHSAQAKKNILIDFFDVILETQKHIETFSSKTLGKPTINIATLQSGCINKKTESNYTFQNQGNITPEMIEALVEIRTIPEITGKEIVQKIKKYAKDRGVKNIDIDMHFDETGFETERKTLESIQKSITQSTGKVAFLDPKNFGYLDIAMLKHLYPNTALCSFGVGVPGQAHAPNEYISKANLQKGERVYKQILKDLTTTP